MNALAVPAAGLSRLFGAIAIVLALLLPAHAEDTVVIETATGAHDFTAEIADTPESRAQGLMYRQSMPEDHGMLFDFGRDAEVGMWMRNTYIPLDMIFINADGTVHRIARNTTPFSEETVSSRGPVRAVFEVNAGRAAAIDLRLGDVVRHRIFSNVD